MKLVETIKGVKLASSLPQTCVFAASFFMLTARRVVLDRRERLC